MKRKSFDHDLEKNILFKELNEDKYKPKVLDKNLKKKVRQWKQHWSRELEHEESN